MYLNLRIPLSRKVLSGRSVSRGRQVNKNGAVSRSFCGLNKNWNNNEEHYEYYRQLNHRFVHVFFILNFMFSLS